MWRRNLLSDLGHGGDRVWIRIDTRLVCPWKLSDLVLLFKITFMHPSSVIHPPPPHTHTQTPCPTPWSKLTSWLQFSHLQPVLMLNPFRENLNSSLSVSRLQMSPYLLETHSHTKTTFLLSWHLRLGTLNPETLYWSSGIAGPEEKFAQPGRNPAL